MKNEPFGIFLTVLLVEKNIQGISPKSGRNAYFLSVLIVRRKIFSTFFLNYEPNAIFLYSLIVGAKKFAASGPFTLEVFNLMVGTILYEKFRSTTDQIPFFCLC